MATPVSSAKRAAQGAERTARGTATSPGATLLSRLGYAAKGIVYLIIGILAARVALGNGGSTPSGKGDIDRQTAIKAIYQEPFGKLLLGLVVIGLLGYVLYNLARALLDTERAGSEPKGLLKRVVYAVSAFSYGALAIGAGRLALGSGNGGKGSNTSTQDWTQQLLDHSFGVWLVVLAGLVVLGVAVAEFIKAYKAGFMKKLDQSRMGAGMKRAVEYTGRAGMAARGVVFGEVGVFLIVAARQHDSKQAKGLGGALTELADQSYGHLLLGLMAIGLIAYGLYSMAEARYRRLPSA